ncbi:MULTISPECIES: hypothetical protein [Rhizobium]|uniref:Uncharacterized protein n=1 Tax=Rhizobium tropici TaxID=398 RepID=A0A6P1CHE0_RHITR|nr:MULTISPECIES: hypothetical protein [Rhizobium]AGB73959.1 hypothetical protein RTCIAT899_PC00755 [Rhizobium tropici CIAT 899]MBB4240445.1 hypothetical protein [Rhizobium tropici]MBB5592139.1 hypothetical protein [Rhizobium tropici]MBB6491194.1 hypothetical protein [Rhizobium tropici]NEV14204.1 hypothetical protein [Rhizobium tropici]
MKVIRFSETSDGYSIDSSAYPAYVREVSNLVPPDALEFMDAAWHYEHGDARCRLEQLLIREFDDGDVRANNIEMHLAGAYGNRITLFYSDVQSYAAEKTKSEWPAGDRSHGDWLIDEMLVLEDGFLSHEIIFTNSVIKIKHRDLKYKVVR